MPTRNVRPFVHLRVLSSYSLGLALSTPADICRHARRIGFDAVALTDVSGTYGFVEFHRAARDVGVKPIYGVRVFLDWSNPPAPGDPLQSLTLLALDRTGLRNVCAAATLSATRRERGQGIYASDLEGLSDGVIALVALGRGELAPGHLLLPLCGLFGERLFIECRDDLSPGETKRQAEELAAAKELGVHPVLIQDIRFVGPSRPQLADLVGSDSDPAFEHRVFGDARARSTAPITGMRTAAEMSEAFDAMPEAYSNASLIASLVQPDLLEGLEQVDVAPTPGMIDAASERRAALRARLDAALAARGDTALRTSVERELGVIERHGLEDAFLQYEAIAGRARRAGVPLGPATGLGMQSRCAWLLGITNFDPCAFDPGFVPGFAAGDPAAPVLDLHLAAQDRPRVLALINQTYGEASIGYVPSVEHITAARALRIAARRVDVDAGLVDAAVRIASSQHGMSLRELSEENRALAGLFRQSAALRELVAHAAGIEGLPYGFARTKRTLIVSPRTLRGYFGYTVNPETGEHFVQATRDSFPVGAIRRIDIATLHVLGMLRHDAADAPVTDASGYRLIGSGDLDGIHLLEGPQGRLAPAFGVASFSDLVHFVAILRQRGGPPLRDRLLAFRRDPHEVPASDQIGDLLAPTNGWLLFEDQLRDVLVRLTGLSPEDAVAFLARLRDHSPGNLAALRREFLSRTVEVSVSIEDATLWFARLLRQSRRVLDRQRVVAECLVVHRCLAFKGSRRLEFFARLLDHVADEKKRSRYQQVLATERAWLGPDVYRSGRGHRLEGAAVRAPLWSGTGVPRDVADVIIRMRDTRTYTTVDEFRCALADTGISLEHVDALIRVGAFDADSTPALPGTASRRVVVVPSVIDPQPGLGLPAAVPAPTSTHPFPHSPAQSIRKDGNPRHGFRVVASVLEFYPHPNASPVELAGRIRNLHSFKSSSGQLIGFFELFDSSGSVRVFVPWERVARNGEPLSDGSHVTVRGKVRLRDGRKVCDALEIVVTEGGNGNGETSPDEPSEGDP